MRTPRRPFLATVGESVDSAATSQPGSVGVRSQPTTSRRWDRLRPVIATVLAEFVPHPHDLTGEGTVLVDGTIAPTWDWSALPGRRVA